MSLADRKKAALAEEVVKNQIPSGNYRVRLKDWKFGKSKGGKDMYTLTWKIIKNLEPGDADPVAQKGKERKTFYVMSQNWSIVQLLELIENAGADLNKMDDYKEIDDVLEKIEDTKMPKAVMKLTQDEGKQFPKIVISELEQVLQEKKSNPKTKAKTQTILDEDEEDDIVTPE